MKSTYPKFTLLTASFYVTFLALAGTTLLTFAATLSPHSGTIQTNTQLMDSLLFENAINLIAAYMYSFFLTDVKDGKLSDDEVTNVRYLDWLLTTPMLLIVFALYFDYLNRDKASEPPQKLDWRALAVAFFANASMLLCGYLGEQGYVPKALGGVLGFFAFAALLNTMYTSFVESDDARKLFVYFAVTWGLYGVAYFMTNPTFKNISYNVLDLLAKVGLSLFTVTTIISNNRGA